LTRGEKKIVLRAAAVFPWGMNTLPDCPFFQLMCSQRIGKSGDTGDYHNSLTSQRVSQDAGILCVMESLTQAELNATSGLRYALIDLAVRRKFYPKGEFPFVPELQECEQALVNEACRTLNRTLKAIRLTKGESGIDYSDYNRRSFSFILMKGIDAAYEWHFSPAEHVFSVSTDGLFAGSLLSICHQNSLLSSKTSMLLTKSLSCTKLGRTRTWSHFLEMALILGYRS
jgi:hypothetical protein